MDAQANEAREALARGVGGQDVQILEQLPGDRQPHVVRQISHTGIACGFVGCAGQNGSPPRRGSRAPVPCPGPIPARAPASGELVLDGFLRPPVVFGELGHTHEIRCFRAHGVILSVESFSSRPRASGGFLFFELAFVDGHGIEPWSRSLPRIHDLRDLDWGQPAPPLAGYRRIDQSRHPAGARKLTPYLSVGFQLSTWVTGFPSAMPDGFPRHPARLIRRPPRSTPGRPVLTARSRSP